MDSGRYENRMGRFMYYQEQELSECYTLSAVSYIKKNIKNKKAALVKCNVKKMGMRKNAHKKLLLQKLRMRETYCILCPDIYKEQEKSS